MMANSTCLVVGAKGQIGLPGMPTRMAIEIKKEVINFFMKGTPKLEYTQHIMLLK
jgi:hypothetical protein